MLHELRKDSAIPERPPDPSHPADEETMDRAIERAPSLRRRGWLLLAIVLAAGLALLGYRYFSYLSLPAVQRAGVEIAPVTRQAFQDIVNLRVRVVSEHSYVLSASEGGRIERRLVDEGNTVTRGQLLVEVTNSTVQLNVMARQTELATQLNQLRANQIAASQRSLDFKRSLLQADKELAELRVRATRLNSLQAQGYVSTEQLDNLKIEQTELQERRRSIAATLNEDQSLSKDQASEFSRTVTILRKNIETAQQLIEGLSVRAPIDGRLSSLTAEVGATMKPGDELGRVDDESHLKLQADVDQYFLPRIRPGLRGVFSYTDASYAVEISKVYPKVQDGQFRIDLRFIERQPPGLALGQNLSASVELGASSVSLLLPTGPFMSQSGGGSVYVVDDDEHTATRRSIQFGRRNSRFVEVQSGLKEGERVIVSNYEQFANASKVRLLK